MRFPSLRSFFFRPPTPGMIQLQVVSDLHLEVNQQYSSFELPVASKYLVLAGDIGRLRDYDSYLKFLQRQTSKFELVFLVLGNHEFYEESLPSGLEKARELEQEPSLHGRLILLHQRRYDIPDSSITVLGCTLWSQVPERAKDIVQYKIQDFQKIKDWSVDAHNAAHESDVNWLHRQIQTTNESEGCSNGRRSILVVTHHAPSLQRTSSPQHEKNPWSPAFATDLLAQSWDGVKVWIFGHTHYSTEFVEKGIRVVSNQRGYVLPWSNEAKGFDANKVVYM